MKTLIEGQLKEYSKIVIETDEENSKEIFTMTSSGLVTAKGFVTKMFYINNNKSITALHGNILQNHSLNNIIGLIIKRVDSDDIVALILADDIEFSDGYRLRMTPIYD